MAEKEKPHPSAANTDRIGPRNHSFNIHRCFKDFKDNWQDSPLSAVYSRNPTLTEGSTVISYQPGPDLFSEIKSSDCFSMNNFEWISIDKIAILFNVPPIDSNSGYLKRFWEVFDEVIYLGRAVPGNPSPVYAHSCKWFDDFYIQWGCEHNNTVRIEFNPNNADAYYLAPIFAALKKQSIKTARVSRLDIAVDYAAYLNPLSWYIKLLSCWSKYGKNENIQTLNFGAATSDRKIRIYNKQAEVKSKKGVDLPFDFWRVEAEVTGIKGGSFRLNDLKTVSKYDPFVGLEYYDPFSFELKGQGVYNLFVHTCRAYGVDFAASQLERHTRNKYLDRLSSDSELFPFNRPSDIYSNIFPGLYKKFIADLQNIFYAGHKVREDSLNRIRSPDDPIIMKRFNQHLNDLKGNKEK